MAENFRSVLAPHIVAFLHEKRATGCRYVTEAAQMQRLDRYLCTDTGSDSELSRAQVETWIAKQPHERPRTHKARVLAVRQFALFLQRRGIPAHVPDPRLTAVVRLDFVPYIFTREQIRRLLEAVDHLPFDPRSPERQQVMPELFRLLYGCGFRVGEVLRLRLMDVNLDRGVLIVRQSKFRKDRLVPVSQALTDRLRTYAAAINLVDPDAAFFPNRWGECYSIPSIYSLFRQLLRRCGIPHGGRGRGPRLHDLRHTFAVHCLEQWYRHGEDLNARLPLLVAYLGHESLRGTQRYLRLTPSVFPDITTRLECFFNSAAQVREE